MQLRFAFKLGRGFTGLHPFAGFQVIERCPSDRQRALSTALGFIAPKLGARRFSVKAQDLGATEESHSKPKGVVWFWGNADDGRLGVPLSRTELDRDFGAGRRCTRPEALDNLPSSIKRVALGAAHSIVLLENGDAYSFGLGSEGQLGLPPEALVPRAPLQSLLTAWLHQQQHQQQQVGFSRWPWRWMRWSRWTPLAVRWAPQQQPHLSDVAAGAAHSVWVSSDGHVYTCGRGTHGQLGHVSTGRSARGIASVPKTIERPLLVEALARSNVHAVQAVCGDQFTLIRAADGSVYGSGSIEYGQLGLGHPATVDQTLSGPGGQRFVGTFRRLRALHGEPVAKLFAGFNAAGAILKKSGELVVWGKFSDRIFWEPTPLPSIRGRVQKVAFGFNHVLVLVELAPDGLRRRMVYSWGSNENGCLGLGYGTQASHAVQSPQPIEAFMDAQSDASIIDIAAGYRTSYAIRVGIQNSHVDLYSWGSGLCGALGLGDRMVPDAGAGTIDFWEPVHVFRASPADGAEFANSTFHIVSGFQHAALYSTRVSEVA